MKALDMISMDITKTEPMKQVTGSIFYLDSVMSAKQRKKIKEKQHKELCESLDEIMEL